MIAVTISTRALCWTNWRGRRPLTVCQLHRLRPFQVRGTAGLGLRPAQIIGQWEADFWSDPVLIARSGDVPAEDA